MRTILLSLMLPLLFALSASAQQEQPSPAGALVFTNVTVIDVAARDSRQAARLNQTVVVSGSRITAAGEKVRVPAGSQVIDAAGKYLIPGLWDMHVHALRRGDAAGNWFPLFLANGVTGVRDMGSTKEALLSIRKRIASEHLLAPRLVAAGPPLDGSPPQSGIGVGTPAEARQAVASLKEAGVDFIKVYNLLSRETYAAIAAEAKRRGLPLAGHVPISMTALEASDAGQQSIEHLLDLPVTCSTIEAELRREQAERGAAAVTDWSAWQRARWRDEERAAERYSPAKCREIFRRFKRNGTWIVPTNVNKLAAIEPGRARDERARYADPETRAYWEKWARLSPTPEESASRQRRYEFMVRLVGEANEAGALILAGTDVGSPFPLIAGFSLHEELELMVKSGLTPLQALRTATLSPAEYLRRSDSLGTVTAGKLADLVLLDANPLDDIRNTRRIAGVVVDGRYLPEPELQKLLEGAEAVAKGK